MGSISMLDKDIESSIFYHRDRNEELNIYISTKSDLRHYSEQYNYFFIDEQWIYQKSDGTKYPLFNNVGLLSEMKI